MLPLFTRLAQRSHFRYLIIPNAEDPKDLATRDHDLFAIDVRGERKDRAVERIPDGARTQHIPAQRNKGATVNSPVATTETSPPSPPNRGAAYGALVGALFDGAESAACPLAPPASPEELGGLLLPMNGWARRAKTALDERFCEMWWLK